jgi:hypothetical protein
MYVCRLLHIGRIFVAQSGLYRLAHAEEVTTCSTKEPILNSLMIILHATYGTSGLYRTAHAPEVTLLVEQAVTDSLFYKGAHLELVKDHPGYESYCAV